MQKTGIINNNQESGRPAHVNYNKQQIKLQKNWNEKANLNNNYCKNLNNQFNQVHLSNSSKFISIMFRILDGK